MKKGEIIIMLVLAFGFPLALVAYGMLRPIQPITPPTCEDVQFVERRFGFDYKLTDIDSVPSDHIIYRREVCTTSDGREHYGERKLWKN